jgi:uncharacterized protein YqgC (DUF456 family)
MVFGFVGIAIPLVPGPAVIWASCVVWAWATGFAIVGWPTLVLITVMAAIAQGADLLLAMAGARAGRLSMRTSLIASVGAGVGLLLFSIPGALIGAAACVIVLELRRAGGNVRTAARTGGLLVLVHLAAVIVEVTLSIGMVAVFVVAALGG